MKGPPSFYKLILEIVLVVVVVLAVALVLVVALVVALVLVLVLVLVIVLVWAGSLFLLRVRACRRPSGKTNLKLKTATATATSRQKEKNWWCLRGSPRNSASSGRCVVPWLPLSLLLFELNGNALCTSTQTTDTPIP